MRKESISNWLIRFLYHQVTYLLTASAIVAIFWAITSQAPSLPTTLIYTFILGNLTALALENAKIPYAWRRSHWSMFLYVGLLLIVIPVAVVLATAVVFVVIPPSSLPPAPRTSFWTFLATAWRFPMVASVIFGGGYLAYVAKRSRLEDDNRELQATIKVELANKEGNAAELKQARDIQEGLLPKDIAQIQGFRISAAWEPAKTVGGDYYDVIRLSEHTVAICIADVSGKGISAALLMANVQAAVRAFASQTASPAQVCSQINAVLCNNTASDKFVTLFYGVLDGDRGVLHYTSAGHPSPLLIKANGAAYRLESNGAVLGVFADWNYQDASVELIPGDLLLLFTDGITEATNESAEEFGEQRLISAVTNLTAHESNAPSQVLEQVKSFCGLRMSDDATFVVVAATDELNRMHINQDLLQYAGAPL